jgi:hypothetical protein
MENVPEELPTIPKNVDGMEVTVRKYLVIPTAM